MSAQGEKKNPDKLNTVGIVTVGLAGSAMVYIAIIGVQALYQNETSQVDEVAQFGRQADVRNTLKAEQVGYINEPRIRQGATGIGGAQLHIIPIEAAKDLVLNDVKVDPANLVPAVSRSEFTTIKPVFGRPVALPGPVGIGQSAPPPPPVDPAAPPASGDGAAPPAGGTVPPTTEAPAPAAPAAAAPAPTAPAPTAPAPTAGGR